MSPKVKIPVSEPLELTTGARRIRAEAVQAFADTSRWHV
jgi:hypothetical protein